MTADEYVQKLFEISLKKSEGLKEILTLTQQQSEVIISDSTDELQKTIDAKQIQMDIIDQLDQSFDVYYSRLKSLLRVESLEEVKATNFKGAAELKQIITKIYEVTKQIQIIENENNNKVKDMINKLGTEIRQIKQGMIANNGYNFGSKLQQQSYYFDTKK